MRLKIHLSNNTYNTLRMFGDISEVTNRLLASDIDIMRKPPTYIAREDRVTTYIDVTDETYLALVEAYGIHSNIISIARLLEWFVNEEVYEELGWTPCNGYDDPRANKIRQAIAQTHHWATKTKLLLATSGLDTSLADRVIDDIHTLEATYGEHTY